MFELFIKLIIGHAVMDYWAQSDALAKMKNRNRDCSSFCPPGQTPQPVWFYALTAHSVMHGAAVWYITGNFYLFFAETIAHWVIDFGKCDNHYGMKLDQSAHIFCKIIWVIIIWSLTK